MVLVSKKQKGLPSHHRKRQAHHHKKDDRYHKPYWPYLPLLGIAGLGFFLNILWAPLSQTFLSNDALNKVLSFSTNTTVAALLAESNIQRTNSGVGGLTLNSQLNSAAQAKANDMASRNYWSHETPDGGQPWQFIAGAGYAYTTAGENLAYGFDSSTATVLGWMNSPGHKANLLNSAFRDVGFGIAQAEDYQGQGQQTIVVAMYGATAALPSAVHAPAPVSTPTGQAATVTTAATSAPTPDQTGSTTATTEATSTPSNNGQIVPTGTTNFSVSARVPDQPQQVTRMELVSDTVPSWSIAATLSLVIVCAFWFISRHLRAMHRVVVHGEQFIIRHAVLDMAIVSIITIGVLLTRTAGFIN